MKIYPSTLKGSVCVPPSKSLAHRAIICAALSDGACRLSPIDFSDDIRATLGGMSAMGVKAHSVSGDVLTIEGGGAPIDWPEIDCIESGSTLRFLMALSLVRTGGAAFIGKGKLGERPMKPFEAICAAQGVSFEQKSVHPMRIELTGQLSAGDYFLPGNVTSQFATGLLFSLPLLDGDSRIRFDSVPESIGYIHLTMDAMKAFGVTARWESDTVLFIPGNQRYSARDYVVEGDYSQAAVFLCAGALGADVLVEGLDMASHQGDAAVLDILRSMGAEIVAENGGLRVRCENLHGATIDVSDCPDIAPILALTAALANGETQVINAGRLRFKECDRLHATVELINALGGHAQEFEDGMRIVGVKKFAGGCNVSSYGDHRMAMLLSIAALHCEQPIEIDNSACVSKSYPNYWRDYNALGGRADV